MTALLLLYKIAQLFLVMAIGFALVKLRVVKSGDSVVLSRLALYLLMPAAIINSFNVELSEEILGGFALAIGAGIVLHLMFVAVDLLFAKFAHGTVVERASVFYSNAVNLIIPIVSFVLGDEWVIYSLGFMSVQLCFVWSHGVGLFERGEGIKLTKILLNPCILAIAAGFVLLLSGIRLPEFVSDITASLGGVLGYVGMLIAGMTAASLNFKKMVTNPRIYLTTAMRVIICPLLSLGVLLLMRLVFNIPNVEKILLISFLATMTPTAATIMQFSQIYDTEVEYSVAINIMTTLVACATMPLLVLLYQAI
ncbi:MAG: AEC family transporter [Clostridia bacterium]|nr:AEC family transporter [Clostridia bacterium]